MRIVPVFISCVIVFFCSCSGKKVKTGYYHNGQKSWELHITDEKPDGVYTEWDSLGHITQRTNYRMGVRDGRSEEWNSAGQLIREEFYTMGKTDSLMMVRDTLRYLTKYFPDHTLKETYYSGRLSRRELSHERLKSGPDSIRMIEANFKEGKISKRSVDYWDKGFYLTTYEGNDSTLFIYAEFNDAKSGEKITMKEYQYKDGKLVRRGDMYHDREVMVTYTGKDSSVTVKKMTQATTKE